MTDEIQPFERLMLFFHCLKEPPVSKEDQMRRFRQISGFSESEAESALDVCIVKGFVGDAP